MDQRLIVPAKAAPTSVITNLRVRPDIDWAAITVAGDGLGLKTDGSLWQVGPPGSLWAGWLEMPIPQRVGSDSDWVTVTAGWEPSQDGDDYRHYSALKADGTLFAWGANTPVPLGTDKDWAAITAGDFHSAALKQDGSLWAWGANGDGQLGIGTHFGTGLVRAGLDNDWLVVEAGGSHTVALKADGSLWAWGANSGGQLGIGNTESSSVPVRIGTDNDWGAPALPAPGLRITSLGVGPDAKFRLSFSHSTPFSYFILYRGTDLTNISQPVDATLGPFVFQLSDPTPVSSIPSAFYRVRAVPFAQPLDIDGDGIDDGYELRHRAFLNPFKTGDAALDFDADGRSNLQEYRDGTDPAK